MYFSRWIPSAVEASTKDACVSLRGAAAIGPDSISGQGRGHTHITLPTSWFLLWKPDRANHFAALHQAVYGIVYGIRRPKDQGRGGLGTSVLAI